MPGAWHDLCVVLQVAGEVWGMDASLISQMKAIEEENRRLKRMYADLSMQADLIEEALEKK